MQKRQWIRIYSQDTESRKKKEYIITELGRQAFETEKSRLEELLNNAKLMEEGGDMIRFRLYYNKDTETEWLNKMAADGWALTGFFAGFYRFEACEKGEYTYQVDLGAQLFSVSSEYRDLMEELGVEIVTLWGTGSSSENVRRTAPLNCTRMWNLRLSTIQRYSECSKSHVFWKSSACS